MTIREATPEDAAAIAAVHVGSWRAAYAALLPPEFLDSLSVAERAAWWEARLTAPDGPTVLVAPGPDGRLLGFSCLRPWPDADFDPATTAELAALYTLPEVWGTGLGRRLAEASAERLLDDGFRTALLWVLAGNQRARRFYEAAGWRADGTVVQEETGGVTLDELRYARALTG
ncbi:GNAT family N-acetyltransferase [Streptomyces gulbargensis]|uniref:GNAT family N-acetyltransferase n=1 Tax=Streptomyces gulbargensis TaxID=364901 RepID=A0ABP7ML77_9ACTN